MTKKTGLERKPMKSKAPARNWEAARAKVEREGACRYCGDTMMLEAAHVIGRKYDRPASEDSKTLLVRPDSVVVLCRRHHEAYDRRELDLMPYLHLVEQVRAVEDAGGIASANKRISGAR